MNQHQSDSLVTIVTYTDPIEAHIMKGRLHAEGIVAFIVHEHHIWANWTLSQALGGVKIQVLSSSCEAALKVIADAEKGEFNALVEEASDSSPLICKYCGSTNIETRTHRGWLFAAILSLGLLSIIFPLPTQQYCQRCNKIQN